MNLPFWSRLEAHGDAIALVEAASGRAVTYFELACAADEIARTSYQACEKALILLAPRLDIGAVTHLVAGWRAGHAVHLASDSLPGRAMARLLAAYKPDFVTLPDGKASRRYHTDRLGPPAFIDPALTLMLSTSGSTGQAKSVRLSKSNLAANAAQIVASLEVRPESRALLNLPLFYTYGLSVLTSHLSVGACVVLDERSYLNNALWADFTRRGCDELHGVPSSYAFIRSAATRGLSLPRVRTVSVSGGRLTAETGRWLYEVFGDAGASVYKMYGLTEATARATVTPPHMFGRKMDSVGLPVPGSSVSTTDAGEILIRGPHVMMGYARRREDLMAGDTQCGTLFTGDLGRLDEDGYLYILGRIDRQVKIAGVRLNLDELEHAFFAHAGAALVAQEETILILHESPSEEVAQTARAMARALRIPQQQLVCRRTPSLPRRPNGKIDYAACRSLAFARAH